jgi:hypothetical protein
VKNDTEQNKTPAIEWVGTAIEKKGKGEVAPVLN